MYITCEGTFEEFILVEDYTPKEEDRKQRLMAKAGEVVKVLQKKESGMLYLTPCCFYPSTWCSESW